MSFYFDRVIHSIKTTPERWVQNTNNGERAVYMHKVLLVRLCWTYDGGSSIEFTAKGKIHTLPLGFMEEGKLYSAMSKLTKWHRKRAQREREAAQKEANQLALAVAEIFPWYEL
jgi:hypothetical protein